MYVVSSRSRRVPADGEWVMLESTDGKPPANTTLQSDTLPDAFLNSLVDPLIILVHGYNNTELQAFGQYAQEIGTAGSQGLLPANGFKGSVIGFDWPSVETTASNPLQVYENDLKAASRAGAPALSHFLSDLSTAVAGRKIHINIMAHSMGNFLVRTMLMGDPTLGRNLDNIISFGADILVSDLEKDELKAAADALARNWFVYWAQADLVLLSLSNWANFILGDEQWGGQRLGQQGVMHPQKVSPKVVAQDWDSPIATDIGSTYSWDLRQWQFNPQVHCQYWTDKPFLKNVADNLMRAAGTAPITINWPLPPKPWSS